MRVNALDAGAGPATTSGSSTSGSGGGAGSSRSGPSIPFMLLDIFIYSAVFYIGTEMTASALKKFKARRAAKALQVRHSVTLATTRHKCPCCSLG
jgi:uncharacterized BrkB/YihY/UPF0761 family membrane protein